MVWGKVGGGGWGTGLEMRRNILKFIRRGTTLRSNIF